MSHQALTAKYRPQAFSEVAGQEMVKAILSRASLERKVAPAYLFSGTRGVGKTTLARIFAKALNCRSAPGAEPCNVCDQCRAVTAGSAVDVVEIDGASNRGIDDVRRLREVVGYAPMEGGYKIFIIDEAHMLSREAFNALLKTLEEPPARVTFIMATTEPHKFPATIISRCQHFVFKPLSESGLLAHLSAVLVNEGVPYEENALRLIARRGAGSVRDSMSLLGQVLALGDGEISEASARNVLGLAGQEALLGILEAVKNGDSLALSSLLRALLDQGLDMGFFLRELCSLWRTLFMLRQSGERALAVVELPESEARRYLAISQGFSLSHIHACWQMTLEGQRKVLTSLEPALALELLLLNLGLLPELLSLENLSAMSRKAPASGTPSSTSGASGPSTPGGGQPPGPGQVSGPVSGPLSGRASGHQAGRASGQQSGSVSASASGLNPGIPGPGADPAHPERYVSPAPGDFSEASRGLEPVPAPPEPESSPGSDVPGRAPAASARGQVSSDPGGQETGRSVPAVSGDDCGAAERMSSLAQWPGTQPAPAGGLDPESASLCSGQGELEPDASREQEEYFTGTTGSDPDAACRAPGLPAPGQDVDPGTWPSAPGLLDHEPDDEEEKISADPKAPGNPVFEHRPGPGDGQAGARDDPAALLEAEPASLSSPGQPRQADDSAAEMPLGAGFEQRDWEHILLFCEERDDPAWFVSMLRRISGSWEGGTLILEASDSFLLERLNDPAVRERLEETVREWLGGLPPLTLLATTKVRKTREDLKAEVMQHPLVREVQENCGGYVIDFGQIR